MSLAQLSFPKPGGTELAGSDRRKTGPSVDNTYSMSAVRESNVETRVPPPPSELHTGQRVKFHDRNGKSYHGELCWTGRGTPRGLLECNVVGIKTVSEHVTILLCNLTYGLMSTGGSKH